MKASRHRSSPTAVHVGRGEQQEKKQRGGVGMDHGENSDQPHPLLFGTWHCGRKNGRKKNGVPVQMCPPKEQELCCVCMCKVCGITTSSPSHPVCTKKTTAVVCSTNGKLCVKLYSGLDYSSNMHFFFLHVYVLLLMLGGGCTEFRCRCLMLSSPRPQEPGSLLCNVRRETTAVKKRMRTNCPRTRTKFRRRG